MKKMLQNYQKKKSNLFKRLPIYLILIMTFPQVSAQTISIQGKLTAYRYWVRNALITFIDNADTTNKFSVMTDASGNYQIGIPTAVESNTSTLPTKFKLEQNYPNPFSTSTVIPYNIHKPSNIEVTIYDILGREVRKFNVGQQSTGLHNVLWNGRNNFGQKVASGIYFYRLSANGESQVKKMVYYESSKSSISLPQIYSSPMPAAKFNMAKKQNIEAGYYTVRIENTDSTTPFIISEQIDSVQIQNDTTINFSVGYIPLATVNLDSTHQIIRGFGGTNLFFFGRPDMNSLEITKAFGTGSNQLGFSILRIGIDNDSTHWSSYVPTAKAAYDMGVKIIASPWYAPTTMVETVNTGNGTISRVRHDMYGQYAAYLNSFITYMKNHGVPLYGISIQNEPDITSSWTSWTSDEMFTFMKDYADSIQGAKVMDPESFHFDTTYSNPILNDSAACANTDIICGHIYGGGLTLHPLAQKKGKEVWMTEYLINSDGNGANMDTSLASALATAKSINDCMSVNMSAYVWWYIVRFYGPIADGTYVREGTITRKGYVMSQFSRFIRPGFYRVESNVYPAVIGKGVSVTAYKDPLSSKVVIIAINNSSDPIKHVFRIQNSVPITSFTPYTTSETKNCEQGGNITVTGNSFTITIEPSSITTFVSN